MVDWSLFGEYAGIVLALLLLEAVLSFDNAAILAAMVRRLPRQDRRKALFYGLVGAYALRFAVIFAAFWLIDNQWVKFVGGGYLILLFLKHFKEVVQERLRRGTRDDEEEMPDASTGDDGKTPFLVRLGLPMLAATIIQIELVDLAFALDQVLAAVAFVEGYPDPDRFILIVIASGIGIAMLRLAATFIVRVMDWLPLLEHMAYVAVGYVGVKLILTYDGFGDHGYHIPNPVSIGVTLGLFVVPVLIKLLFKWPPSHPGSHGPPPQH